MTTSRSNTKSLQHQQIRLNDEQRAAVATDRGHFSVLAGPGSGKTAVVVSRYKRLLELAKPGDVLSLTFTKEAAAEMRKRAGDPERDPEGRPHGFMTFHSLALAFVLRERDNFPFQLASFPLADEQVAMKMAGQVVRKYQLDYKDFRQWMSLMKGRGYRPDSDGIWDEDNENVGKSVAAYREYDQLSRAAGVMDFDSLLLEMVDLLATNEAVRERWQYQFVQVDESQDADAQQWKLVKLISERHSNVFAVGDVGQCVYQWRSAMPELFLNFDKLFPGAQRLYLAHNYRSTGEIVDFCKRIGPVKELADRFKTDNELGEKPQIVSFYFDQEEAEAVSKMAAQRQVDWDVYKNMHSNMALADSGVAILARTNRGLRPYEDYLASANVRYHLLGKSGFFNQREVINVLAFAQIAVMPTDYAVQTAIMSPFHPSRFLRKKELVDSLKNQSAGGESFWNLLTHYRHPDGGQQNTITSMMSWMQGLRRQRQGDAQSQLKEVIAALRVNEVFDEADEFDNSPRENLAELVQIAARFPDLHSMLEHIRKVKAASKAKKGIALSTIHQAKGKEWPHVFVIGVEDGMIPHKNGQLDEEARIFFVACSRAAKQLHLSYAGVPSRFLTEFIKEMATDETAS